MKVKTVVIVGGTHGNEYTGEYFVRKFSCINSFRNKSNILLSTILANPKAFEECVRFIDSDLNRSFLIDDLEHDFLASYEANRAKVINNIIGPKGDSKADFIIDLHTTTANMGITIILVDTDDFNLRIAAYIKSKLSDVYIYYIPSKESNLCCLNSIATKRLGLEIGPIPNGVLRHDIFEKTESVIAYALDFVDRTNLDESIEIDSQLEVFERIRPVRFPLDSNGKIIGMVHKDLQDNDFHILQKGDPIFYTYTLAGKEIVEYYNEDDELYPLFINEAAYYYEKTAFSLAKKKNLQI